MVGTRRYISCCAFLVGGLALAGAVADVSLLSSRLPPIDIQQALTSLEQGAYAQAEKEALALAGSITRPRPRAWSVVAAARQRQGRFASAAKAYRLFLASTESAEMRQFALRQIETCRRSLQPPAVPAAPSSRMDEDDLAELAKVDDRTYTESTEHFVVHTRNAKLAKVIATEAELALNRICGDILAGQAYPHSVRINVWPDHDTYLANAADAPEWAGGNFTFSVKDGLVTRQIDLTQRDTEGSFAVIMVDRVLPHEMCHLVLREYFGDAACPLFLNEGLAMMAEYAPETRRLELAGHAIAGKARISLQELLVQRRYSLRRPSVFYAEAFSLIEFLHSRMTPEQLRSFLGHVKAGCTACDALQRSLYVPASESFLTSLASAWEDHAVEQAQYIRALADRR